MADTLETAYANSTSTTPVVILDGASSTTYTILSLLFCQTGNYTVTFSLYRTDSGGSTNKTYIYKNQSIPYLSTFEHTDKIVLEASQELWFESSGTSNLDVVASYLKQTSPTGDVLKEHSTILTGTPANWDDTTNGGSNSDMLPVAATTRTVLSISICNASTSVDITFDIGYLVNDTQPHRYLYRKQSVPALSTFIHNSKLVVASGDNLQLRTPDEVANTDLGIVVSYLEQS